jgi:hypothetical protein
MQNLLFFAHKSIYVLIDKFKKHICSRDTLYYIRATTMSFKLINRHIHSFLHSISSQCTEVRFASFFSGGFITAICLKYDDTYDSEMLLEGKLKVL